MSHAPPTRHRWFQFGLRTALVVVAVIAIVLAWHMRNFNRQRSAIARVLQLGGRVTYDYQLVPKANGLNSHVSDSKPSALGSWLGVDHVQDLSSVDLAQTNVTDDDLRLIVRVRSLHGVDLQKTKLTNSLLERLKSLSDLQFLNLHDTRVDDQCLEYILCHKHLRLLQLSKTDFSNAGLGRLGELTELVWMDLSETRLSDEGLEHLSGLKKLEWLVLWGTSVTPKGVERLRTALPSATIIFP